MRFKPEYGPEWQRWFAWYPVWNAETQETVWWEHLERKFYSGGCGDGVYDYRNVQTKDSA